MSWSLPIFRVAGIQLRIHVTFLLLIGWLAVGYYAEGGSAAAAGRVFFILLLFVCAQPAPGDSLPFLAITTVVGTILSVGTSYLVMRFHNMGDYLVLVFSLFMFPMSTAFLLGTGLGVLLINFTAPAVSLLDLTGPSSQYNPFDIPPVQTVIPYPQLFLLLGGLVIVCLAALLLMARIVSRPSLGQALRLNED